MEAGQVYIGIDVAKEWLDITARPGGDAWRTRNEELGIGELVVQLMERAPRLIVLEATGGLETALAAALTTAALPFVIVNPRQVPRIRARHWSAREDRRHRCAGPGPLR